MKPYAALLEELRAIAQTGLHYNQHDPYNRERYERLLTLASQEYAALGAGAAAALAAQFKRDAGYITPKTGTCGVVLNEKQEVLLVKRSDNGKWALPGGYAEVGMYPEMNAQREIREETGIEVRVGALIGVYSVLAGERPDVTFTHYTLAYLCTAVGGALRPSHETPVVGYYDPATITHWHSDHQRRIKDALKLLGLA